MEVAISVNYDGWTVSNALKDYMYRQGFRGGRLMFVGLPPRIYTLLNELNQQHTFQEIETLNDLHATMANATLTGSSEKTDSPLKNDEYRS